MAVAFRAAATLDVPADDLTWDVPTPSGTVDGDVLFAFLVSASTATTCATPAGWTIVEATQVSPGGDSRGYVFRKIAASEGASTTFTWSGGTTRTGAACMVAYSGEDQTTPLNGSAAGTFASSATPAGPALTPSVDNCLVVAFFGCDQAAAGVTWTAPAGYTERVDFQDTGPLVSLGVFGKLQTTAGAETPTPTQSTADEGVAFTVAIAPAAAAGGTARSFAVVVA